MMNIRFSDDAAQRYFDTLPPSVQENVKQSGMTFLSEEQLRACAAQLLGGTQSAD